MICILIEHLHKDCIFSIKNFPYCNPIRVDTRLVSRLVVVWCKKLDMCSICSGMGATNSNFVASTGFSLLTLKSNMHFLVNTLYQQLMLP